MKKFLISVVATFLLALLLIWANYVWIGLACLPYWKCLIVATAIMLLKQWLVSVRVVWQLAFAATIMAQILAWSLLFFQSSSMKHPHYPNRKIRHADLLRKAGFHLDMGWMNLNKDNPPD